MSNAEKLLYLENSLSQQLIMFYLLGNTAFTIFCVVNMNVDFRLGIFVMVNIFLSLLAFLMAVRQKTYVLRWGYGGLGMAAFQLARLLWIPEELTGSLRIFLMVLLIASSIFAFAGSIICIKRSQERDKYIRDNHIDLALLQK
ncbi:MAG: hypothetical protein Kow0080_00800 [Candidatus Promineifilaceae bacterium]